MTSSGRAAGQAENSTAAAPATCGAAMLVPVIDTYGFTATGTAPTSDSVPPVELRVDQMLVPGAARSGRRAPVGATAASASGVHVSGLNAGALRAPRELDAASWPVAWS